MTKEYIQKELLSETGRLKRKVLKELNLSEEIVYIKYLDIEKPKCLNCDNNSKFLSFTKGYGKFCSKDCQNKASKTFVNTKFSDLTKKDITKEYIEKYVLDKKGNLNANISRFLPTSNEELYLIYNNMEKPKCKECNNTPAFRKFSEGYYDFCSVKCAQKSEITRNKQGDTLFERYGTRDPLEIKDGRKRGIYKCNYDTEVLEKSKRINQERYGGDTSFSSSEVQDKVKETFIKNYGVDNPMFSDKFIEENFVPILETKRKPTYFKRYGVSHPMKNKDIKNKVRVTNEKLGNWITEDQVKDFRDYTRLVWRYTNQNNLSVLENFELRAHTKEGYHLDHKYSIYQGFKDKIEAKIIGNICNLEMLISGQNLSKNRKCSITKEDLLYSYYK